MPYLIVLGWGIWDGDVQRSPEGGEVSHIEEILLQNLFLGTAQPPPLASQSLPSIPSPLHPSPPFPSLSLPVQAQALQQAKFPAC